ncbi:hypothetical protein ACEWY4_024096 [Coilia grayii]|uniref:Uncharacterized protein n=1 Tax=Coilia grayii TaxID=363190 RepID=A0ABD1IZD7_9TELE
MTRLPHLTVCLLGALLLMPFCRAEKENDFKEYDTTLNPDYDDYNATFEYIFFSNSSSEDLERFIKETEEGGGSVVTGTDVTPTEGVTVEYETQTEEAQEEETQEEEEEEMTKPPNPRNTPTGEACRSTSPRLLIALGLLSHLWARLL